MISQYLHSTERPDSGNIVQEVQYRTEVVRSNAYGLLSTAGQPASVWQGRLFKRLGISHQAAHITTLAMTGGAMQHAQESRKTRITVQYLDYLAPVDKSDVLFMPMRAYNLVLGVPWFPQQNPDIDWARIGPCDHRVQVERCTDTDDYGSGMEGLTSW